MKRTREEIPLLRDEIRAVTTTLDDVNRIMANNEVLLKAMLTETRRSRECFASVYKRDKLNTADFEDLMIIREGTENVRGGNCIIDADIWVPKGKRKDVETFESLYGVLPEHVSRLMACKETVDLVDKHAEIIASKSRVPTDEFHATFKTFIDELISSDYPSNYPSNYLTDTANPLFELHWKFLDAANYVPRIETVLPWED